MDAQRIEILIVDDEPRHIELIARAFESQTSGVTLFYANTLGEANQFLAHTTPDLVIADLRLPDGEGAELLPGSDREGKFPIVILTGHGDERAAVEAMRAGASDYVVKSPATLGEIARVADRAMRDWRHIVERKLAESELRRSESRFRDLFEGSPDAILVESTDGGILDVNREACRLHRMSREELIGTNMVDLVPPHFQDTVRLAFPKLVNGELDRLDGWCAARDGSVVPVAIRCRRIDYENQPSLLLHVRDISVRKQAERKARESEQRFRLMVDAVQDYAIYMLDLNGHVVSWNKGAEHVKGYTAGEIVGRHFSLFYPQEAIDAGKPLHELQLALANGRMEDEGWRIRKDGSQFWANVVVTLVRDDENRPIGFAKVTRDLTERRRSERALQQGEEQQRAILASSLDPVLTIDAWGVIKSASNSVENVFGWKPSEVVGRNIAILMAEPFRSQHDALLSDYRNRRISSLLGTTRELLAVRRDGSPFPCEVTANIVEGRDDDEMLFVGTIRDITVRKQMEEQLRRADRLASTGTLAAGIAHEINNPLSAAWTAAEMALKLKDKENSKELVDEALRAVVDSVQRCNHIIQNVLRFSRNQPTKKSPNDINEVIRRGCEMARSYAEQNAARLELDLAHDLPQPTINPVEIEQVIVNLLENAIEASDQPAEIGVRTAADDDHILFSVVDKGAGLSGAEQARIFDPFYTNRRDESGIGLGLSIAYRIVEEHGGSIEVASQVGVGTTVSVKLPIKDAGIDARANKTPAWPGMTSSTDQA